LIFQLVSPIDPNATNRFQWDRKKEMLLTPAECSKIIAYNELNCQRVISETGIASYVPAGTQDSTRPMRTFKLAYSQEEDVARVTIEDNFEVVGTTLSKADYVLLQILIRSSIPFITGFQEMFNSPRALETSADANYTLQNFNTASPPSTNYWE
jgi:hypothetical protein